MSTIVSEKELLQKEANIHMNKKAYDWKYIIEVAKKHKKQLILANIIAIVATLASIPVPLLLPLLVDEVLLNKPGVVVQTINSITPSLWHEPLLYILSILVLTLFLRISSLVLSVFQTRQFTIISKDLIYQIRRSLLSRLNKVSMTEYETLGSGTVTSYFVTDLSTVDEFVGTTVSRLLIAVLTIIGVAIILIIMHWQIAILILFANPIVIYFTKILGKHVKELKKKENSAFAIFQQSLTETLDSIHQIRASNREKHYFKRVIENARNVREHGINFEWKSDAANRLSFVVFLFGFDIFRAVSMMMVIFSGLSIGQMFAVFGYLWFMMGPVQEILNIQYAYYNANAALGRINNLLTLEQEPNYPHIINPFENKNTVAINISDLRFAYGDNPDVLNGIELKIKEGVDFMKISDSLKMNSRTTKKLNRENFVNQGFSLKLTDKIFESEKNTIHEDKTKDKYYIVKVLSDSEIKFDNQKFNEIQQNVNKIYGIDNFEKFSNNLEKKYPVNVNENLLNEFIDRMLY